MAAPRRRARRAREHRAGRGRGALGGYVALYRKWRPHRFADMVGQEYVTRTLRNALATGRLGHAYLFCGPRGTGKTTVARILAQAANCQAPTEGEPCGRCENCEAIAADRFLDLQEIDGASSRGIDEVRALREDVRYAAIGGRTKVYIIDEVHMLTEAAWNALLKTLEEPPAGTLFVLATTDPRKIPLTALSRCQRFDFRRFSEAEIADRLAYICSQEGVSVDAAALRSVARRAEGGMRDALNLLDQGLAYAGGALSPEDVAAIAGAADEETVARILAGVAAGDPEPVLAEMERLYAAGADFGLVCRDLAAALRDRLAATFGRTRAGRGRGAAAGAASVQAAAGAGEAWSSPRQTLLAIDVLATAEADIRRTAQPRYVLEVALLRLLAEAWDSAPAAGAGRPGPATAPTTAERSAARGEAGAASGELAATVGDTRRSGEPRAASAARRPPAGPHGARAEPGETAPPARGRSAPSPAAPADGTEVPSVTGPDSGRPASISAPPPAPPPGDAPDATAGAEPAPGSPPRPAPPPSGPAEGVRVDALPEVVARWPQVLEHLKPSTRALVASARPVRAVGRRLTLQVGETYDHVKKRAPEIAQALAGALGGAWGVEVVPSRGRAPSATAELAAELFEGEVLAAEADGSRAPARRRSDPDEPPF